MKSVMRRDPDGNPARLVSVTDYYQRLRIIPTPEKFTGRDRNAGWREIIPNIYTLFSMLISVL